MESQTLDKERAQYVKRNPAQLRTYYIFLYVIPDDTRKYMRKNIAKSTGITRSDRSSNSSSDRDYAQRRIV
uniref:Uncharacterized protein n=1 Tax=Trichogramma kaykai TaxID=54128 RepID=A0ABD2X2K3_9HYME